MDPSAIGEGPGRGGDPVAGFLAKVRATLGRLPFLEDALAAWFCGAA